MIESFLLSEIFSKLKLIRGLVEVIVSNKPGNVFVTIQVQNGIIFLIKYNISKFDNISSVTENNIKGSVSVSNIKENVSLSDIIDLVSLSFDPIFEIIENL